MRKRILVVTQHFWPENFRINDIVEGFVEDGIDVDVLCGLPNYPRGEWFEGYSANGPFFETYKGARVIRSREIRRKGNTNLRIFLNFATWPLFGWLALPRLPKDARYDAVFCFNTAPVLMCWPAIRYAKRHHIPFTNYVLDLWPENLYSALPVNSKFWRGVVMAVSTWLYKGCDRLIAMSVPLQQRLMERTGKDKSLVAIIPQYCEDFYAVPLRDEALHARFDGRFNIVFAGNFSPVQSLDTVMRAAVKARAAGAADLRLLMVGDGMSRDSLVALAQELDPAGDTIVFTGSVPATDVPKYAELADGLVASLLDTPDLGMTVPAKIASYMAAGKPVLASMDGAAHAAVSEAGNLASPACDVDALAANMVKLYAMTADERAAMGQKAKNYYQNHYRREVLLRRLEKFILRGT